MTRCVKDLREIVNISRLSYNNDCEEWDSDEYDCGIPDLDVVNIDKKVSCDISSYILSRPSSAYGESCFNTVVEETRPGNVRCRRPRTAHSRRSLAAKDETKRPASAPIFKSLQCPFDFCANGDCTHISVQGGITDNLPNINRPVFPSKFGCVPPIQKESCDGKDSNHNRYSYHVPNDSIKDANPPNLPLKPSLESSGHAKPMRNFDSLFMHMDGAVVATWLEKCQGTLHDVVSWFKAATHFVDFANFCITELSMKQRQDLLDMEFSIIIDQLKFAFSAGIKSGKCKIPEIYMLAKAVIHEYQHVLASKNGDRYLIDIITVFCKNEDEEYRTLLKNVRCETSNKQFAQWILAFRIFAFTSLLDGLKKFFSGCKRMHKLNENELKQLQDVHPNSRQENCSYTFKDLLQEWTRQAVLLDYGDVLMHLVIKQRRTASHMTHNRHMDTLLALAVKSKKLIALERLLKYDQSANVNHAMESGNSLLHIAASRSDIEAAKLLIQFGARVNIWNAQSEGACPLHVAVMNGDLEMVDLLLKNGADASARMGVPAVVTPISLAKDMGHRDIVARLVRKLKEDQENS